MLHIIYNPTAGRGKAKRARSIVSEYLSILGVPFCFYQTEYKAHAKELARAVTEAGGTEIVVMGGDGTLHEVVNGLADPARVTLGLIPCGSGNDFASCMGISKNVLRAARVIAHRHIKPVDYFICSDVRGINAMGAGIDVEILQRCYKYRFIRGKLKYLFAVVEGLAGFRSLPIRLKQEEGWESFDGFAVIAGNGTTIGGGMRVCPEASVSDGMMDMILVKKRTGLAKLGALLALLTGKISTRPYTYFDRRPAIEAAFDRPTDVEIDGEIYENLPLNLRVVHNELHFFIK